MTHELTTLLRPAGRGIHVVSTGTEELAALTHRIYGKRGRSGTSAKALADATIEDLWRAAVGRLGDARAVILGVPCDVGAGFARGAAFGPGAIRGALLDDEDSLYHRSDVIDVGDVFVVPQLLHDEMVSEPQAAATRAAIYGPGADPTLPVSPLSIAEAALDLIRAAAPRAVPLVLGGDHSVGWPAFAAASRGRESATGILHFDAHTDLLESRLGIRYCFATWAYHANELVGRGGRLAQVGLRTSGRTRAHWEETLGVRQYWMAEVRTRPLSAIGDEIIAAFVRAGVTGVYVSNDIDATDPSFAAATGTPEPGGLAPGEVVALIDQVAGAFPVIGSDVVEVAPPLGHEHADEPRRTVATAARYAEAQLAASLP